MGFLKRFKKKEKRSAGAYIGLSDFAEDLSISGYVKLSDNPEVVAAVRTIADLISSMTLHLMANTEQGDQRIVNELSRKVDINPCSCMTRKTFIDYAVTDLLLYGKGNAIILPTTRNGILEDLIPIPPNKVNFQPYMDSFGYDVLINNVRYPSEQIIHLVHNPDKEYPWKGRGITTTLASVADNLRQAQKTTKDFLSSKWKPSVIIKVDALIDEFTSPEGRTKLADEYIKTNRAGEPWIIPADQFSVEQVRPLSLADLAIDKNIELDKKTVASLVGVPPFLLGVGTFNAGEWNNFISSTVRPIAIGIQQEFTKKLLLSPKWYWKFNVSSLYSYDIQTLANVYSNLYVRGIVDGNEVREKLGMSPREGLGELVILENYIPLEMIANQKKLEGDGDGAETD